LIVYLYTAKLRAGEEVLMMTKADIINFAIGLAKQEIDTSTRNHNLLQVLEIKRLIRKFIQLRDEI
jgi:hypothetical protein